MKNLFKIIGLTIIVFALTYYILGTEIKSCTLLTDVLTENTLVKCSECGREQELMTRWSLFECENMTCKASLMDAEVLQKGLTGNRVCELGELKVNTKKLNDSTRLISSLAFSIIVIMFGGIVVQRNQSIKHSKKEEVRKKEKEVTEIDIIEQLLDLLDKEDENAKQRE